LAGAGNAQRCQLLDVVLNRLGIAPRPTGDDELGRCFLVLPHSCH
jgi:hypothetical protein